MIERIRRVGLVVVVAAAVGLGGVAPAHATVGANVTAKLLSDKSVDVTIENTSDAGERFSSAGGQLETSGYTVTACSPSADCSPSGGSFEADFVPPLGPASSKTFNIKTEPQGYRGKIDFRIFLEGGGTHEVNDVPVDAPQDPAPPPPCQPGLGLGQYGLGPDGRSNWVGLGQRFSFYISVRNSGTCRLTNVVVGDDPPPIGFAPDAFWAGVPRIQRVDIPYKVDFLDPGRELLLVFDGYPSRLDKLLINTAYASSDQTSLQSSQANALTTPVSDISNISVIHVSDGLLLSGEADDGRVSAAARAAARNPAALARVDIAVRALRKDKRCVWLANKKGALKRRKAGERCAPRWLRARGASKWRYKVRRLPPGHYRLYVRAVNKAGVYDRVFARKHHNVKNFSVRLSASRAR